MNQSYNKYDLLGQLLGSADLQGFVDKVMSTRHNVAKWKSYFAWDTMKIDDSFDAMEAEVDLYPMASLIDYDSPKPKRATQGITIYSGKIPKMGHAFELTEQDLRQMMVIINRGGAVSSREIFDLMYNTVNKLEFGAHARLNYMGFQGMSTGKIVVDSSNNPDGGVIYTVDLRVPSANKKYAGFSNGVSAAWTDPTATPLTDLKDWVEWAEDNYLPTDIMRMSKNLWRTFSTHPNVIKDVRAYFANTNLTGGVVANAQLRAYMNEIGLPLIEIIDERSGLQLDGVTTNVGAWDESNITLSAAGQVGLVKNAEPISVNDPSKRSAFTEGGRIKIVEKNDDSLITRGFEMEALAVPILSSAKQYSIMDTSQTTTWS